MATGSRSSSSSGEPVVATCKVATILAAASSRAVESRLATIEKIESRMNRIRLDPVKSRFGSLAKLKG